MCEQIIVWRDDFENIPLEEWFVEKWGTHETIFISSCVVLMESRGNFHLGRQCEVSQEQQDQGW